MVTILAFCKQNKSKIHKNKQIDHSKLLSVKNYEITGSNNIRAT